MNKKIKIGQTIYPIDYAQTLEDLKPEVVSSISENRVYWANDGVSIGIEYIYTSKKEAAKALIEGLIKDRDRTMNLIDHLKEQLEVKTSNLRTSRKQFKEEYGT